MYWIDYIYRYWHYYRGEGSRNIYKQAPAKTMKRNYLMFHTMDPVLDFISQTINSRLNFAISSFQPTFLWAQ